MKYFVGTYAIGVLAGFIIGMIFFYGPDCPECPDCPKAPCAAELSQIFTTYSLTNSQRLCNEALLDLYKMGYTEAEGQAHARGGKDGGEEVFECEIRLVPEGRWMNLTEVWEMTGKHDLKGRQ